ncbi:MAG: DNA replication/repair protein RecF [candidate division Zixibacteria bacterium]|nr:DNA replication/repair protein RecF [candidate division Zixibacteria bacterium]
MIIESSKLTTFRNFSSLKLQPDVGINVLYGQNGSGKTNLLESIFLLCLGRSHRSAQDAVMISTRSDVYRVEGSIRREEDTHRCSVAYQRGTGKKITINNASARVSDLFGKHCVVSAGPEDGTIITGSPSVRRTFLDTYLSQLSREYLARLIDYQRVLAQKNAALRKEQDPGPFNVLLVPLGAVITQTRNQFLRTMDEMTADYYSRIASGGLLKLEYRSSICGGKQPEEMETNELSNRFESRLQEYRERETIMRAAMVGPHRDDLYVTIADQPARTHASQGESRTAAIAMKLAVYHLLRQKRQDVPVLLLDEIFSELDSDRTNALVELLTDFGQLFLTTAVDPPEAIRGQGTRFQLRNGEIVEMG